MINNDNYIDDKTLDKEKQQSQTPNESTGLYVRGFVKITDPETGQIILETGN